MIKFQLHIDIICTKRQSEILTFVTSILHSLSPLVVFCSIMNKFSIYIYPYSFTFNTALPSLWGYLERNLSASVQTSTAPAVTPCLTPVTLLQTFDPFTHIQICRQDEGNKNVCMDDTTDEMNVWYCPSPPVRKLIQIFQWVRWKYFKTCVLHGHNTTNTKPKQRGVSCFSRARSLPE